MCARDYRQSRVRDARCNKISQKSVPKYKYSMNVTVQSTSQNLYLNVISQKTVHKHIYSIKVTTQSSYLGGESSSMTICASALWRRAAGAVSAMRG